MKNSFWKNGLSIKETEFSMIGLLLLIVFVYILVYHTIHKDINSGILDIFKSLLLSFVGVNTVDKVSTVFDSKTNGEES